MTVISGLPMPLEAMTSSKPCILQGRATSEVGNLLAAIGESTRLRRSSHCRQCRSTLAAAGLGCWRIFGRQSESD